MDPCQLPSHPESGLIEVHRQGGGDHDPVLIQETATSSARPNRAGPRTSRTARHADTRRTAPAGTPPPRQQGRGLPAQVGRTEDRHLRAIGVGFKGRLVKLAATV